MSEAATIRLWGRRYRHRRVKPQIRDLPAWISPPRCRRQGTRRQGRCATARPSPPPTPDPTCFDPCSSWIWWWFWVVALDACWLA
jgi:hypothetical protein